MKKPVMIWAVSAMVLTACAQDVISTNAAPTSKSSTDIKAQTNETEFGHEKRHPAGRREKMESRPQSNTAHTGSQTNRHGYLQEKRRSGGRREKMDENEKQQRRIQLMERELKRIGVTDEEKAQITALQKAHKVKMEANTRLVTAARNTLSELMDAGASMEELESAILEISDAQAEQLRILVRNRIEMERILGKQKHDQFMKNARMQYQKYGRRGGPPLPPRPGQPPIPGEETDSPTPAPPQN